MENKSDKVYFWIKLRIDFYNIREIRFLMENGGSDYVVLYQMLCLNTANTDGEMIDRFREMIVPYTVEKIVSDTRYFSVETVKKALELYRKLGLIYENDGGNLVISNFRDLVGTKYSTKPEAQKKRKQRDKMSPEMSPEMSTEYRDKSIEYRDKSIEIRDQSTEHGALRSNAKYMAVETAPCPEKLNKNFFKILNEYSWSDNKQENDNFSKTVCDWFLDQIETHNYGFNSEKHIREKLDQIHDFVSDFGIGTVSDHLENIIASGYYGLCENQLYG